MTENKGGEKMNDIEEITEILKLTAKDIGSSQIEDFDDYGTCHKSINRIVVEIARYAMMDISSELDHEGAAYLPPGSKTFHTTTLNRWVEDKCRAVLLPYGVPEKVVKRAVKSIMSRTYEKTDEEGEWKRQDTFQPSILELGECLRVGEGRNVLSPTRYIVSEGKGNHRLLISPYPTKLLRDNLEELRINFTGILRTASIAEGQEWPELQEQSIDDYASIPEGIKPILRQDIEQSDKFLLLQKHIMGNIRPQTSEQFFEDLDLDGTDLEIANREQYSRDKSFMRAGDFMITGTQIPCYKLLRFGERHNKSYFIAIPSNGDTRIDMYPKSQVNIYPISVELWKYVIRIFLREYPEVIQLTDTKLHLQKRPPASGIRIINAYGGNYVTRNQSTLGRGYYEFDDPNSLNIVKNFLLDYSLYEEGQA